MKGLEKQMGQINEAFRKFNSVHNELLRISFWDFEK